MPKRKTSSTWLQPVLPALQRLVHEKLTFTKFKGVVALFGALVIFLYRHYRLRQRTRLDWRRRTDLSVVQAVLLSTERFEELGRVEKRTLFIKNIAEVFKNGYIRERIIEAAQAVSESGETFFMKLMEHEDKWHVLTECQNHISSLFAPYHIFFNEAKNTQSYYHSAWYCFTLTCQQSVGPGRFFITPSKPVIGSDTGMMRIRIVLVSEKDLRDIASGAIEPPASGFFSSRHEGRWQVIAGFADLFARQLERRDGVDANTLLSVKKEGGIPRSLSTETTFRLPSQEISDKEVQERGLLLPEDNQFLRTHIPFPSVKPLPATEIGAQDVVLFE